MKTSLSPGMVTNLYSGKQCRSYEIALLIAVHHKLSAVQQALSPFTNTWLRKWTDALLEAKKSWLPKSYLLLMKMTDHSRDRNEGIVDISS